jgi:hypothetical protein
MYRHEGCTKEINFLHDSTLELSLSECVYCDFTLVENDREGAATIDRMREG